MASPLATTDTLNAARSRARSVLSGFTAGQKVVTVLSILGLIGAGVLFVHVESQPNFQPLFTNLQITDAGAVTAQLTTAKIPYELTNGGTTVLVPANLVDQERVTLSEQGLPASGTVGFSNLEKSGITTSQFVQQVEYQQALEGQLQQTIGSIEGIVSSLVSLVIPAQSSFAIGSQPATTASVLVRLLPGTTLTSEQVQAIVHLTAAATPGLSASDVTVVDDHGHVLSSPGGASSATGSSDSQETIAYDDQLAKAIENLLDPVVGTGNSVVQVHAQLNFNQQSTTTVGLQVNAQGQPVLAPTGQTTTSQSYTGSGTPPSPALTSGGAATSAAGGNYTSTNSQVTNAVGQVTQTVNQAPGQVIKTSVAVLLNSAAKAKMSQSAVTAMVSAAAGLNTASGDQVVVTLMPFAAIPPVATIKNSSGMLLLIEHGVELLVLVLLILAMIFLALRSARRTRYDEIPVVGSSQSPARPAALEAASMARLSTMDVAPEAALTQVSTYIEQRPSEVARLLRTWAGENKTETP